jgi:hypothetical protein
MTTKPQKYRVIGQHGVLDHNPGDVFVPNVSEEQLRRLVDRGSLEPVTTSEQEK